MVHMHIDDKRLAFFPIPVPQGKQLFCRVNDSLYRFQIGVCHKRIKISGIEILIQVNGIVQPRFLRRPVKVIRLLQPVQLILREVHIQLQAPQVQFLAQAYVIRKRAVFN